ncbi:hypothetical protein Ciccas_014373, partial [Cichlidogyrus casuarinus]
ATLAVAAATTGRRPSELLTLVEKQQKLAEARKLLASAERKEDACVGTSDSLRDFPLSPTAQQVQLADPTRGSGNFPLVIDTRTPRSVKQAPDTAPLLGLKDSSDPFRGLGNQSLEYAVISNPKKGSFHTTSN